ncbi:EAL domain-containing protein [Luteimonas sp. Y-2-2-4F]|nr:EAL domain-containing protein [Luteimonas sp. Y-2-2-4F]MCD9033604.1 EAL domain-containing protein [Luteimonas sp. Y-2-2-4F]
MGNADDILRAESPPAHFWRRWAADAPPPAPAAEDDDAGRARAEIAAASTRAPAADATEPPFRVMIVEDDPSQALFAESILAGAGMQTQVVADPDLAIETLERFRPDLVLMDLHMPSLDGVELTTMIRRHGAFSQVPIVFLTGDPDPERQFEVLEIGADDFLSKPVRPRHLLAAVDNRIRRARAARPLAADPGVHPATGLLSRDRMLQRLAETVSARVEGALFLIEIEGVIALRDRIGYAALDALLREAAKRIAALGASRACARLNDITFLILAHEAPAGLLDDARTLRDGLARDTFQAGDEALRLRARVGALALPGGFDDAGSVLAAAERALRDARLDPLGIAVYAPPQAPGAADVRLADLVARAIAEDRLELAYQPIVAVSGGNEAQFQTLLRLRDDQDALLPAGDFLPVAEDAGLLHEIDRRVLDLALAMLDQQRHLGRRVRLFVSQSPRSLGRDGHAARLLAGLGARGLEGADLIIDVRQDDALVHAVSLQEFCTAVQPAGVQLCLSGYRTGTEADSLLAQLPLSYVRLAAHYSVGVADQAVRDEMREAIDRAHRQGLLVIGQQVENPQAAATLWMSGIDFIQGNLVHQAGAGLDFDFQNAVL